MHDQSQCVFYDSEIIHANVFIICKKKEHWNQFWNNKINLSKKISVLQISGNQLNFHLTNLQPDNVYIFLLLLHIDNK